jgi:hypothetical protein
MGNLRADIPVPALRTPPLGGAKCPDNFWNGGRALVLQGPSAFLGPRWVLTAHLAGQPAVSAAPPVPPEPIPGVVEGSIPFVDVAGTVVVVAPPPEAPEGSTAFIEDTETS